MRRSSLARSSEKHRNRGNASKPVRELILAAARECMICGASPARPHRDKPRELSQLCCHEIACGAYRQAALNKPYAILALCWWCNGYVVTDKATWPQSRQLSVLQRKAPQSYDLKAFNYLINPRAPNRITQDEVDRWNEENQTWN